ncbi:MAG: hypothetical protein Q9211_007018, partial [Gyalolechia sp. 1 TL-2023]
TPSSSNITSRRPSLSTLFRRTMSLGSKNLTGTLGRRNTFDGGQAIRPSSTTSPEGSLEGSGADDKVKGKGKDVGKANDVGKRNVLKRRGSGR